jgi:hypothetical protein
MNPSPHADPFRQRGINALKCGLGSFAPAFPVHCLSLVTATLSRGVLVMSLDAQRSLRHIEPRTD